LHPERRPSNADQQQRELSGLIRRIQALTVELEELRLHAGAQPELRAKERTREQLRSRLATVARHTAIEDLGNAA
jgi:hypothetical protein